MQCNAEQSNRNSISGAHARSRCLMFDFPTHSFSFVSLSVIKKYEFGLYKFYLIEALRAGRREKVGEFFEKMHAELSPYPEWKEWFCKSLT